MKDPVSRRSRGFGFITFDDVEGVDNALANEPHTIDNRKVEAKRAVPRSEVARAAAPVPQPQRSQTVPPAPPHMHAKSATSIGSSVSHASVDKRNGSGSSGGGGGGGGGTGSGAAGVSVGGGGSVADSPAFNKVFVGGLHYDTRDAEFRNYFEAYGRVVSAAVMFNRETHKSRGFGFVIFEQEMAVDAVCAEAETSLTTNLLK
jgi:RNA recognition motif-containing protein